MSHFDTNLAPLSDKIVALKTSVSQLKFVANIRQNCRSKTNWGNKNVCHHLFLTSMNLDVGATEVIVKCCNIKKCQICAQRKESRPIQSISM